MIIDALLILPLTLVNFLIGQLPAYTGLPAPMVTGITTITDFTKQLGDILPTNHIWVIILLTLTIEIGIAVFNGVAWFIHWKQSR